MRYSALFKMIRTVWGLINCSKNKPHFQNGFISFFFDCLGAIINNQKWQKIETSCKWGFFLLTIVRTSHGNNRIVLYGCRVREDGQVYTSIRLTVVAACRMYLNHFPMDVQVCNLKAESFGYDTNDVVFEWLNINPLDLATDLQEPEPNNPHPAPSRYLAPVGLTDILLFWYYY